MTELLTAAQMRAIEADAISAGKVTGLDLMERAGQGVVDAVFAAWPALRGASDAHLGQSKPFRALVLCGPGNNGGDGFVVARLLAALGWVVEVFHYGEAVRMPPDARLNYGRWCAMGRVRPITQAAAATPAPDLIVDAIFGTGLSRALPDDVVSALRAVFELRGAARFVGVDCASGICMDSGRVIGAEGDNPFPRDLVVQFHQAKIGQYLMPEAGKGRAPEVVGIGLPAGAGSAVRLSQPLADFGKTLSAHKYSHGHALILSGGMASGGAARLAARGALRIGAGVVTVGCPPAALMVNAARLDAVMVRPVRDAAALEAVLDDRRINALCLGPGMGLGAREAGLIRAALQSRGGKRAVVLDADALSLLAQDDALFDSLHEKCVLTPHAGEFARLFPDIAARLAEPATKGPAYSKVDATREAAKRAGCVVLFKGPDTVIAAPDGQCAIAAAVYERAAPWLATAGAGDVLAGFITGLLARGFAPMQAAESGAWLHVECARSFGAGLIAEDLPEALPKVFQALGVSA